MNKIKIVCMENAEKYYGVIPKLIKKFREIERSGVCPFCLQGIEKEGYTIMGETEHWRIIKNEFFYKASSLHLLILPKRHITSLSDLTLEIWQDMSQVLRIVHIKYLFSLIKGYGLALRVGESGGATLYHLHWHFIVPEQGKVVEFGVG